MALAKTNSNADADFIKVGPDATATFDNSANPTEHASSENLNAVETEDDDLEDEDLDEDDDDEEEDYEEEEDEEESDDDVIEGDDEEDDDDDDDDDEDEEEDEDLATSPRASSVYRKA